MSQQAAKRRRKQAAMGYTHICKRQRPNYKKRTAEASAAREAAQRVTRQRMAQGKSKK